MAKAKRVYEIAKEMGVKSKAIVEKCQAEGVPGIENHMSTVKIGLVQTIHEWFGDAGEGGVATAVETAEKVDLQKVRKKAARKKATKAEAAPAAEADAEPTEAQAAPETEAVVESKAAPKAAKKKAPTVEPTAEETAPEPAATPEASVTDPSQTKAKPLKAAPPEVEPEQTPEPSPEAEAQPEPVAETQAETEAAAPSEPQKPAGPMGQVNVPTRPDVVKPAGEQLQKPKQAELKGPKVVRIEKPEPMDTRPPRRRGPGGPGQSDSPPPGTVAGISRSRGPVRGGGVRGGGGGGDDSGGRRRRMVNTRRGRSADALPTGPTNFSKADMEELDARLRGASGFMKQRRRDLRKRDSGAGPAQAAVVTGGKVEIAEPITIKSLSAATGIKSADIIKHLFKQGVMATINSAIGPEAAMEVALEYNIELEVKEQETAEQAVLKQFEEREKVDVRPRPPVVTILGHVDHGKTSLLDRIRKADVAAHESGGITQHVGAYRVTVKGSDGSDKSVVFLDTPGHEAFTSMRSRGAGMTDLVVLVCAADDGVMPQTIESINHAKAAGVPLIVALNKIDVAQATEDNIQKIYGQLAEHGLNPVDWGGETEVIKTSAETGQGIEDLIEVLDYQAELLELKADYGGPARGAVIETEMQPGRGSVARVLVQEGQIKVGDTINIGRAFGRVREMTDDRGRSIKQAGPATPLELSGIDEIPDAGDKFYVTESLRQAEEIARQYREAERQKALASQTKITLDNFADAVAAGQTQELRVVLKADVQGSVDVLRKTLAQIGNQEVAVKVLHAAVGGITESDVVLADASDAVVVGFHVTVTPAVREIAEARKVDVRLYRVIYDVTDDVKKALEGMLEPDKQEERIGAAQVKEVFKISKVGSIAGCLVTDGMVSRQAKARVVRDGVVVTDNRQIESLRRVKDDAKEVRAGTECGIRLAGFDDLKPGDEIVCYKVTEVQRTLD